MASDGPRQNIEIKARVADPPALLVAARSLGARDMGVMQQVDTYFHVPRGRLKLREIAAATPMQAREGEAPAEPVLHGSPPDAARQEPRPPSGARASGGSSGPEAWLIFYERPNEGGARRSDYTLVPVAEPAGLRAALTAALGVRARVEKERRLLLWRQTRIHLDTVAGLGEFVELETVLDGLTEEEGRAQCAEVMRALGIGVEELLEGSYGEMGVVFPPPVPTF